MTKHPQQPIEKLSDKSLRYRGNEIVKALYAVKKLSDDQLQALYSKEDWVQLQQLLGCPAPEGSKPTLAKRHPIQPVVLVGKVARFKENQIVSYLLDNPNGPLDLNYWARRVRCTPQTTSDADYEQLMQLIGFSVSGAGDIPEVSNRVLNIAQKQVDLLVEERDASK